LGSRPAGTGGPILTIYTSSEVFPHKEVPFGGHDETAPHLGCKILKHPNFGGVNGRFQA